MSIGRLTLSAVALTILLSFSSTGCVVKDDPDRQFDLFYSGLEEWSLELQANRATLDFRCKRENEVNC